MKKETLRIVGLTSILLLSTSLVVGLGTKRGTRFDKDEYTSLRAEMVEEQIKARGVTDKKVLSALLEVPRHKFVPQNLISSAYDDRPLPIGLGQTISQPYIVGLMTEILKLKERDKVLEVGTGSGYQAAILSKIVKEVYTIEILDELAKSAKARLAELGFKNVHVRNDDGYYGLQEKAPFDAIIVTAAANHVPPPLIQQLKEGGLMCIPLGGAFSVQNLILIEKLKGGKIKSEDILPVRFVPLLGGH